jgi:hypothetical protein
MHYKMKNRAILHTKICKSKEHNRLKPNYAPCFCPALRFIYHSQFSRFIIPSVMQQPDLSLQHCVTE